MRLARLAVGAALVCAATVYPSGNWALAEGDLTSNGAVSTGSAQPAETLIPWPKSLTPGRGAMPIGSRVSVSFNDPSLAPLAKIFADEISAVAEVKASVAGLGRPAYFTLELAPSKQKESYTLTVTDRVTITGGDYESIAEGSATVLQAIHIDNKSSRIARMSISDRADTDYRGLMIDLARNFHPVSNLEQIIEMCRLYKIRYLHLHLSDDQSFTFPSRAFPALATKDRSYSQEELAGLVKFAKERGVTIVPEIDMPGHASALITALPELAPPSGNVLNFASPKAINAATTLVDEMAETFPDSPYIHIGGDEANLGGLSSDPTVVQAITDQNVGDISGLFNHFINLLDARVKSHGKRTIAWEGLGIRPDGPARVNSDVIIEPFDNYANAQDTYVADGHDLINTSWFPLYVLRDVLFGPQSIYEWNIYTFGNYRGFSPRNFEDIRQYEVTSRDKVLGAQVCSWEQSPETEIPTLRRRLAAMADRAWNRSSTLSLANFMQRLDSTDATFSALLTTKAPDAVVAAATDSVYADRVVINWVPPVEYATKYTLLRGVTNDPGSASAIASDIKATHFVDQTAQSGTTYYYWVKAANRFGYGPIGAAAQGSRGTDAKIATVYDGFDYPADATVDGAGGGTGWAGAWQIDKSLAQNANAKITFKPEGLNYPGLKTTGGCLNFQLTDDKDRVGIIRTTEGTQGVPGTQLWVSYLLRGNKIADGDLWLSSDAAGSAGVGKQWGNGISLDNFASNVGLEVGKTYLIVARIDCMQPHDAVRVWVDPPLGQEPDENRPGRILRDDEGAGSGKTLHLNAQEYGSGDYDVDEIRMGATWRDVMPQK
jgi:hexosaminidase